jgi:flagellar hook-associated protein FlgK
MSASQEALAESLRTLDTRIAERENAGEDSTTLREERQLLLKQLAKANAALNESSNILKG